MANTIPCPNPVCTHLFSPAELQSAAQVLCPKCGFRLQGQAPAAKPAAAPAKPMPEAKPAPAKAAPIPVNLAPPTTAKPAPAVAKPIPVPAPAKTTPPMAVPVPDATPPTVVAVVPAKPPKAPRSDNEHFNPAVDADAGELVRTATRPKRGFNWVRALIVLFILGFAGCVIIVVGVLAFMSFGSNFIKDGGGPITDVRGNIYVGQIRASKSGNEKIYKLALLNEEWEVDRDVKSRFDAHAAWKHKQYDFWFALVVQDFGVLKPRDAEMLRIGIDKLETFYGDALEMGKKAEPAKIRDLPAQKIQFKGQIKAANWLGECYMFFNNGIAYWLYIASPDWNTVELFADELPKKNFFIESERRGWREQPPPMETYASGNGKLTVNVLKGVWEKLPNAKDVDENGTLYLSGKYLREKDNRKNASMLVITMKKEDDLKATMKAAREYLDSKVKNENENYKIALAAEVSPGQTDGGAQENIGNRPGRLVDLKRQFNDEVQRYYLLAVVNEADSSYAVLCDCTWDSRQIWRQDFLDVIRSMNFKKAD